MEPYDALATAIKSTEGIVGNIDPSQYGKPTLCTEWSVRDLLNHTVGTLWITESMMTDREPRHAIQPGALPSDDLVGVDPAAAFAEGAKAALAAASVEGTMERTHQSPLGEMPGAVLVLLPTTDMFVHGWDLARATGQQPSFDEELAEQLLGFCTQSFEQQRPPAPVFGALVEVPADAAVMDRLVGYLGRQP